MRKLTRIKILLIAFSLCVSVHAQYSNIRFNHYSRADGLSHGLVFSIMQDNAGYLWFATQDGLNKYDGAKFTVFQSNKNDSNALGDNWINSLCIDNQGELWVGSWDGGLHKFNARTQSFTRFTHDDNDKYSIGSNKIQTIIASRNGDIWAATWGGGVSRFDKKNNKFINYQHIPGANSISENKVYTVFEDKDGIIWLGTNQSGLDRLDPKTGNFTNFRNEPSNPNSLSHNYILDILEDDNNKMWVATYGGGLNLFDKSLGTFEHFDNEVKDQLITSLLKDSHGNIWVGSDGGGVYLLNKKTNRFVNFRNNSMINSSLNDNRVWAFFEDRSGLIWIGTFSGGLNVYDYKKNKFKHLTKIFNEPNSLIDNFVKAIYEDDKGNLWIGTNSGISIFDRKNNVYKHLKNNPGNSNSLSSDRVRVIVQDRKNIFWIGTWGGGLNKFDPATEKFTRYLKDSSGNSISDNYVRQIYIDDRNIIWLATENGLNKFNSESDKFFVYKHNVEDPQSVSSNQITAIFKDNRENFWIGTVAGLNLFDLKTEKFFTFKYVENKLEALSSNRIRDIYQDKKGNLWIGTFGEGLNKFNYETKTFSYLKKENGLPNNVIYNILEDDDNNLWISTNSGICRYNYLNEKIKNFSVLDGLQGNEFNGGAALKNRDGELFFGGTNGINIFNPRQITDNLFVPPIAITEFKLFDAVSNISKNIQLNDTSNFDYDQNYFSFEFASLDFTAPEKNEYMYKLEGIDEEWIYSGNRRYVNYTNLEPGQYIFRVKGSNSDGIWNEKGASLLIIIAPPFWETTWFRILMLLAVAVFIYSGYQLRIKTIRQRNVLLQKLVNERTAELMDREKQLQEANATKDKFFSIIAHDLKSPFTSLLGFSEVLREDYKNMGSDEIKNFADSMYNSARATYRLLENLLEWSRFKTGKIECVMVNLNLKNLINQVIELYKETALQKSIILENHIDRKLHIAADDYMIRTVMRNIISNALKFTREGGSITFSATEVDNNIQLSLEDTGTGISENDIKKLFITESKFSTTGLRGETGTGLGLVLCKEFIEKNKGSISVRSVLGQGSTFIITLPSVVEANADKIEPA